MTGLYIRPANGHTAPGRRRNVNGSATIHWRGVAPQAPHHFLGVLGVRPENQGQGLARALLEELARMCDEHPESTGACLNTEDPGNVPLYEHMGYRTLAHRRIDDVLETWCMFRARGHDEAQMRRGQERVSQ